MSIEALRRIGESLQADPGHHIPSTSTQPRRACVALILRWHNKRPDLLSQTSSAAYPPKTLQEFFKLPWVKEDDQGHAELLFMQRATRNTDR